MTDNEIIEALECCRIARINKDCLDLECPFATEYGCNIDSENLRNEALNLIYRKDKALKLSAKEIVDLKIKVEQQKADIEKFKKIDRLAQKTIDLQTADIKKLEAEIERLLQKMQQLKVDAIKEFAGKSEKAIFVKQDAERKQMIKILKTYKGTRTYADTEQATDNWLRGYGEAVQDVLSINDNLVKEMVGD